MQPTRMADRIAGLIRSLRKEKGMSQAVLAAHCNVTQQAVDQWERAKASPGLDSLLTLARVFHTTTDYLLTGQLGPAWGKASPVSPEEILVIEQYRRLAPEGKNAINSMLKALETAPMPAASPDDGTGCAALA